MDNESENYPADGRLGNMQLMTEEIAFKPEQMIICPKCQKANPPTRSECFYCMAVIAVSEESLKFTKFNVPELEIWEKGFNIIAMPECCDADAAGIERFLSIEPDRLEMILQSSHELPLVRLESYERAEKAVLLLNGLGLNCLIVGDDVLRPEVLPVRLRGLKFNADKLIIDLFNTSEKIEVFRDEIVLIVVGYIFESKTEMLKKRKKKEAKPLSESHTSTDEMVIDIYCGEDLTGYRIPLKGFDFSCLEEDKSILAVENIVRLKDKLCIFARSAELADDYLISREILNGVWELESRNDSLGLQRNGFGKTAFANIESRSNLQQFTKYSRLRRHLL